MIQYQKAILRIILNQSAEINSNISSIYNKRIKRNKKIKKDEKGVAFKSIGEISYEE